MTEAQYRELLVAVTRLEEQIKSLWKQFEPLALRVRALETRIAGGSNGRRLRDRALPLGRDGLVLALIAEVAYRIVTGG